MNRSRSNRESMQDLELRLGPSYICKAGMLPSDSLRGCPEIILIEDDDDDDDDNDLQIYPPAPPGEAFRFYSYSSSQENVIREEDLELHLGVGASHMYHGHSSHGANNFEVKSKDPNAEKSGKASCSELPCDFDEVKLKCSICMDTMREETSTTCGHIFCKGCIADAIRAQQRCPTCQEKLSPSNIHRIYLPAANF